MSIECALFVDDEGDGWSIVLYMAGRGGPQRAEAVNKWLHDTIVSHSNEYISEMPPGSRPN